MSFDLEYVPDEVSLTRAPLVRVLCQVQYSSTPELVEDPTEQRLAELLSDLLPVRGSVDGVLVFSGPNSAPQQQRMRTYEDINGSWKASVSANFLGLETVNYGRRFDFIEKLTRLLAAVHQVGSPPRVTRIGMRYTDRIEGPHDLRKLVHPALLGMIADVEDDSIIENQIQQALIVDKKNSTKIQVRSLCLPPGVAFDPSITPVDLPSWVLDIDAFSEFSHGWDVDSLSSTTELLARRAYQVFSWAVTDKFRQTYS